MISTLFFLPVGPKDAQRVVWTIRSIRRFCNDYRIHLILDGPKTSDLAPECLSSDTVVLERPVPSGGHWGKIWFMLCEAMVEALSETDVSPSAIFVKIDADALVIRAGLAQRAQSLFASRPKVGQIGQLYSNVLGGRLLNAGWFNFFVKIQGWRGILRFSREAIKCGDGLRAGIRAYARFCGIIEKAKKAGWGYGEFAIGGSYILRRELIVAFHENRLLDSPPFDYLPKVEEDVVMTPCVYAMGFSAIDDVADGGLFAIEGKAFRVDPFLLKRRGHFIIHTTKYGYRNTEGYIEENALASELLNGPPNC